MEFLKAVVASEALEIIAAFPVTMEKEESALEDALGRVLGEDLTAGEDIPPFPRSLVDGYAVKVKDIQGARETSPAFLNVVGRIGVGEDSRLTLGEGQAIEISTGAMIPDGADGSVMEEYVRRLPGAIEVTRQGFRGENICFQGEDMKKGEAILRAGKALSAFDMGVLAALGATAVPVWRLPKVAIVSSGDEIVPVDETPAPGRIRDINRYTLSGLVSQHGGVPCFLGIVRDRKEDVIGILREAAAYDMILISGGSSKGDRDFVADSIIELGGSVLFHGINVKPGKPTIFGSLLGKPVFGLPGHPASCTMVAIRFVLPLLRRLRGESEARERTLMGTLKANVPSSYGIEEYVRVTVEETEESVQVTPIFAKSSVISSLSRAIGFLVVPQGIEGYEAGEEVEVHLF